MLGWLLEIKDIPIDSKYPIFLPFWEKATLVGRRRLWRVSGVIASAPAFLGLEVFGENFWVFPGQHVATAWMVRHFPPLPLCASWCGQQNFRFQIQVFKCHSSAWLQFFGNQEPLPDPTMAMDPPTAKAILEKAGRLVPMDYTLLARAVGTGKTVEQGFIAWHRHIPKMLASVNATLTTSRASVLASIAAVLQPRLIVMLARMSKGFCCRFPAQAFLSVVKPLHCFNMSQSKHIFSSETSMPIELSTLSIVHRA